MDICAPGKISRNGGLTGSGEWMAVRRRVERTDRRLRTPLNKMETRASNRMGLKAQKPADGDSNVKKTLNLAAITTRLINVSQNSGCLASVSARLQYS